ncbi:ketoacyl-synt-domain-containing protein [Mytilinidion resinicola]|uniref:Ketoacyl-synt-domain-containing protein n=1 Tax=Mytilinidion resinicola TaxID=574789 RepID=A0A6A6YT48_9PEZI|nr:ketoacyl-synt-domain-containing protein [Mytilinidion resinicola]KAF2811543.1 ketoacyl-synt-domain-containing protein [Mytilinidion resinicola]
MMSKRILFFGDSSQETSFLLDAILKKGKGQGPLLCQFQEDVRLALQEEVSRLPSIQQAAFPDFRALDDLKGGHIEGDGQHPALHLAEVVFVQLAYFINAHEQESKVPYPDAEGSICVGTCVGQLAAAAVSLSVSLSDLIPLAVKATVLAFRTGILTEIVGNSIELKDPDGGSWAMSVPASMGLGDEQDLATLQDNLKIPPHKRAWISAFGNTTISIGGPPSSLEQIATHLMSLPNTGKTSILRRLPIYAPYHAKDLFSRTQVAELLRQDGLSLVYDSHRVSNQRKCLIPESILSPENSDTGNKFFEDVLFEILAKPVDWESMLAHCKAVLRQEEKSKSSCRVQTFGPELQGKFFASGLQKMGVEDVTFDCDSGRVDENERPSQNVPLAIIGMAGRFPSARNTDEFWKLLEEGVDTVQEVPIQRFDKSRHFKDRKIWGCFIDEPGMFDPRFFHMSPREAINTDPAHRLGLTTVQEAMDMAGFVQDSTLSTDSSEIGTFWGSATEEYKEEYMSQHVDPYYIPGSSRAFGPGKVNFIYGFDGPAVSFDTACSSSMVALNHACNSLWNHDCATAIVVGSNILAAPYSYKGLDLGHFLSKTGQCKTFDEHADGYCRGEAVATILVKRLTDAVADDDHILGVIRAISTNHSSSSESITRPHGATQERLFRRILSKAGLRPEDISYAEMHGTGTQAGDTVELGSVSSVLAPERRSDRNPLYVGSAKANVGHGEGASGITSLVKCLLMLREKKIPPHIGIKSGIRRRVPDIDARNVRIASRLQDWDAPAESCEGLRRVLISNFSAAGGNTSMILEEAPPRQRVATSDQARPAVIVVSGKTEQGMKANMQSLIDWNTKQLGLDLPSISYTTTVRRPHFDFRCGLVVSDQKDLEKQLRSKLQAHTNKPPKPASTKVVFTGYTNLRPSALGELFETSKLFRTEVLGLDQSVERLGYTSTKAYFVDSNDQNLSFLQRQLGYVISQIAMYRLATSWGVVAAAVTGHSLGEYVALCASGVISTDDLLYITGLRATALEQRCQVNTHGMLAVRVSLKEVERHLSLEESGVEVACYNSPTDIVLSGSVPRLESVERQLKSVNIQCSRIDTPFAFHSSQMDVLGDDLITAQRCIKFNDPRTPLLSPTVGTVVTSANELGSDFFKRHTRGSAKFSDALRAEKEAQSIWVEVGPHVICSPMIKSSLSLVEANLPLMRKDASVWSTAGKMLVSLYNAGHTVNWKEFHRGQEGLRHLPSLPSYALDEQHYWLPQVQHSSPASAAKSLPDTAPLQQNASALNVDLPFKSLHKLLSRSEQDGFLMLIFETDLLHPHLYEVMQGHMMNDSYLCPAGLYTDVALAIGEHLRQSEIELQAGYRAYVSLLQIDKTIIAPHNRDGQTLVMRIVSNTDLLDKCTKVRFETTGPKGSQVHARCQIGFEKRQDWLSEWSAVQETVLEDMHRLEAKLFRGLSQKLRSELAYRLFDSVLVYGEKYRSMKEIIADETQLEGMATIKLYQGSDCNGYVCCPYWMDGTAHLAGFLVNGLRENSGKVVYLSPGWANYRLADPIDPTANYKSYVKLQDHGSTVTADCYVILNDRIVGKLDGLKFHKIPRSVANKILPPGVQRSEERYRTTPPPVKSGQSTPPLDESDVTVSDDESSEVGDDFPMPMVNLKQILYDETGVAEEDIDADTELADMGIDSLLALTLGDRLRDEYKLDSLSPDLFTTCPTYSSLEMFIQKIRKQGKLPPKETVSRTTTATAVPSEVQKATVEKSQQMEQIRNLVAEQMGVNPSELSPSDDLLDLGLDSLMSIEIVDQLRSNLGFDLDSAFFSSANTLQLVEETLFPKPSKLEVTGLITTPGPKDTVKKSTKVISGQKLASVLQGNPGSPQKKTFLFPDGTGSASVYAQLPLIDKSICIIGFNSPYLKKGVVDGATVEEIVGVWVDELQAYQPEGPYVLSGYSSGGYYAYEAAKTLMNRGQSVETLILIDVPSRSTYDAFPAGALDLIAGGIDVTGNGSKETPAWLLDHFRTSIQAIQAYRPTEVKCTSQPKLYLIWASEGIDELRHALFSQDESNQGIEKFFAGNRGLPRPHGWTQLIASENIRLAATSGNHFSILHAQNVSVNGSLVVSC